MSHGPKYKEIEDESVREIVKILMDFASQAMEENFTVKVDDISEEIEICLSKMAEIVEVPLG